MKKKCKYGVTYKKSDIMKDLITHGMSYVIERYSFSGDTIHAIKSEILEDFEKHGISWVEKVYGLSQLTINKLRNN